VAKQKLLHIIRGHQVVICFLLFDPSHTLKVARKIAGELGEAWQLELLHRDRGQLLVTGTWGTQCPHFTWAHVTSRKRKVMSRQKNVVQSSPIIYIPIVGDFVQDSYTDGVSHAHAHAVRAILWENFESLWRDMSSRDLCFPKRPWCFSHCIFEREKLPRPNIDECEDHHNSSNFSNKHTTI
jgi:hypothetical protein